MFVVFNVIKSEIAYFLYHPKFRARDEEILYQCHNYPLVVQTFHIDKRNRLALYRVCYIGDQGVRVVFLINI